jgi:hypothetical protein
LIIAAYSVIPEDWKFKLKAFDAENIEIPWPHTKVYFGNAPQNLEPGG